MLNFFSFTTACQTDKDNVSLQDASLVSQYHHNNVQQQKTQTLYVCMYKRFVLLSMISQQHPQQGRFLGKKLQMEFIFFFFLLNLKYKLSLGDSFAKKITFIVET